jgi:two-component system phosphate regulon response regulator PhoB
MASRRIIIADDEAYVTTILASKVTAAGYEVQVVDDGEEALALATANPPDLIISDYQMPQMSGYEMAVRLKQNPLTANVPVLMLTARGHHLSPSQLTATNIRVLLAKPFSAKDVLVRVEGLIGPSGGGAAKNAGAAA